MTGLSDKAREYARKRYPVGRRVSLSSQDIAIEAFRAGWWAAIEAEQADPVPDEVFVYKDGRTIPINQATP